MCGARRWATYGILGLDEGVVDGHNLDVRVLKAETAVSSVRGMVFSLEHERPALTSEGLEKAESLISRIQRHLEGMGCD